MNRLSSIIYLLVVAALSSIATAYPALKGPGDFEPQNATTKLVRSANTCADPTLAQRIFQAFNAGIVAHVLNFRHDCQNFNTRSAVYAWVDQQPSFRAWPTQQPFTVPLFQLGLADRTQYLYLTGPDAETPPIVDGFGMYVSPVAWVYDTPVCGSVPLMSAVFTTQTDGYFTTSGFEHDSLVNLDGWVDTGVVAYVLPLSGS